MTVCVGMSPGQKPGSLDQPRPEEFELAGPSATPNATAAQFTSDSPCESTSPRSGWTYSPKWSSRQKAAMKAFASSSAWPVQAASPWPVAGRAEQPGQFAEGVDRVALGHAVPSLARRQLRCRTPSRRSARCLASGSADTWRPPRAKEVAPAATAAEPVASKISAAVRM